MAQVVDRWQRGPDNAFSDFLVIGKPIVPQIEVWAKSNKIELIAPAWKVELAKRVKQAMLAHNAKPIPDEFVKRWDSLFGALLTT